MANRAQCFECQPNFKNTFMEAAVSHYVDGGTRLARSWCIACAVERKQFAVVLNEDKTLHSDASPQ